FPFFFPERIFVSRKRDSASVFFSHPVLFHKGMANLSCKQILNYKGTEIIVELKLTDEPIDLDH
ncbi:MAG: hypothetical protein LBT83_00780, partial [Tannerella sp.]|nr:hypothetical protein [Tannerella sp.]